MHCAICGLSTKVPAFEGDKCVCKLSPNMLTALRFALDRDATVIPSRTASALERRGLVESVKGRTSICYRITAAGRQAIA